MAKSLFEEMGGKYERQGDYLIPCLNCTRRRRTGNRHLGSNGIYDYLKQYRKVTYTNLLTSGRLKISLNRYKGSITYGRVRGRL